MSSPEPGQSSGSSHPAHGAGKFRGNSVSALVVTTSGQRLLGINASEK
jgi:hypothetical protein